MMTKKILILTLSLLTITLVSKAQVEIVSNGTSGAYTVAVPGTFVLTNGLQVTFKSHTANTAGATLSVSGTVAKNITKLGGSVNLAGSDILTNQIVTVAYDGATWQMISAIGSTPTAPTNYWSPNGSDIFNNNAGAVLVDGANFDGAYKVSFGKNASSVEKVLSLTNQNNFVGGGTSLGFRSNFGGTMWDQALISGITGAASASGDIAFGVMQNRATSTMVEAMRIQGSSGYVGIGTTAPAQKLEIQDGHILLSNTGTQSELRFKEASGNGGNIISFKAPAALGSNINYTLPDNIGAANDVLTNDGAGTLSWSTPAPSVNIYNSNGSLTAARTVTQGANTLAFTATSVNAFSIDDSTFSVDAANNNVGIGISAPTQPLTVIRNAQIDKYVIQSTAQQVAGGSDYQNVAIAGLGEAGPGWGYGIGVMGIGNPDWGGTGVYAGLGTVFPLHQLNGNHYALFADAGTVAANKYAGVFMNGNVGIGTTTPSTQLHIQGNARVTGLVGPGTVIADASGNLSVAAGGTITGGGTTNYVARWTPSGSVLGTGLIYDNNSVVGIGTGASPSASRLHVHSTSGSGNLRLTSAATLQSATDGFSMTNDGSTSFFMTQHENANWYFSTNGGTTAMTIIPSGNIGIGTSSPTLFKLHVESSTNRRSGYFFNNLSAANVVNDEIMGIYGAAMGTGASDKIGGFFETSGGTGKNYGVYGQAMGGTTNWAGYFASGNVYIQNKIRIGSSTTTPTEVIHVSTTDSDIDLETYSTTESSSLHIKRGRGTVAAPSIPSSGDYYGGVGFQAWDGTAFQEGARIQGVVDGVVGATDMPGRLEFHTSPDGTATAVERMRITNGGNVGIGITVPNRQLEIGNTSSSIALYSVGFVPYIEANRGANYAPRLNMGTLGSGQMSFEISNDGFTTSTTEYVFGTSQSGLTFRSGVDNQKSLGTVTFRWTAVYALNGTIQTSDAREKKNIHSLDYGLIDLMKLKPVSFEWKYENMKGTHLGFIAQDVKDVIKEVVTNPIETEPQFVKDENGKQIANPNYVDRLGVAYSELIPVLVKSIQEQQKMIEELKREVEALKNK